MAISPLFQNKDIVPNKGLMQDNLKTSLKNIDTLRKGIKDLQKYKKSLEMDIKHLEYDKKNTKAKGKGKSKKRKRSVTQRKKTRRLVARTWMQEETKMKKRMRREKIKTNGKKNMNPNQDGFE